MLNQILNLKISELVDIFITGKKVEVKNNTVLVYKVKLNIFLAWCERNGIVTLDNLTVQVLREFLMWLREANHNPGGVHLVYRCIKHCLLWFEGEYEPLNWKNPIRKVKLPKIEVQLLDPVTVETIQKLLNNIGFDEFLYRDTAIILSLFDSGARATEFISLNIEDFNILTGAVLIKHGKMGKSRTIFLGRKARKAIRKYLLEREDNDNALWVSKYKRRLTVMGLRQIIRRAANRAGIKEPGLHSFRRGFALNCLRQGMDVYSLQKLMGHADLQILQRYLKQDDSDIREAHSKFSPVDNLL